MHPGPATCLEALFCPSPLASFCRELHAAPQSGQAVGQVPGRCSQQAELPLPLGWPHPDLDHLSLPAEKPFKARGTVICDSLGLCLHLHLAGIPCSSLMLPPISHLQERQVGRSQDTRRTVASRPDLCPSLLACLAHPCSLCPGSVTHSHPLKQPAGWALAHL